MSKSPTRVVLSQDPEWGCNSNHEDYMTDGGPLPQTFSSLGIETPRSLSYGSPTGVKVL